MSRGFVLTLLALALAPLALAQQQPPVYIWLEPEWFDGVSGSTGYYYGFDNMKPQGHWAVAGPGASAEFSQGGESYWNSMSVGATETQAECHRNLVIPRAGQYRVWVRYYDHRDKTEPFTVRLEQGNKAVAAEMGLQPVVSPNDEYELYWGFAFAWASVQGDLQAGTANLRLIIDKPGQAWRQVDAVLITDDLTYTPVAREKPPFTYESAFTLAAPAPFRRNAGLQAGAATWKRLPVGGRDFSMWASISINKDWWKTRDLAKTTPYDTYFEMSPPADISDKFKQQFKDTKVPIMAWKDLLPGLYLGEVPNLSPDAPGRQWLEQTKTPFYMMTNYANPAYTDQTGPATYAALSGPLKDQFMGFIHGEALGTINGPSAPPAPGNTDRKAYVDTAIKQWKQQQANAWSGFFKTKVDDNIYSLSIPCLSVDSISLSHALHEAGCRTVGYELDATNEHTAMRIAFERGAARQYGGAWLNYASANFGDACNYFSQSPIGTRGAGAWYANKYAITDGVSASWYRKFYYLNYLGGASAIYWEQGLSNQWLLPGPGTHPIQLSPFGRATEDFQAFIDRLPDRGEPYTPIAFLLSYGHSFEVITYTCKMLNEFTEDDNDRELRELFNVAWYPQDKQASEPIAPDRQSMIDSTYGNIFDVLVDRPNRMSAIDDYPIVWAAGNPDLTGQNGQAIADYVQRGGTLVVNVKTAKALPETLLGVKFAGKSHTASSWMPAGGQTLACTPYTVEEVALQGKAQALATDADGSPLITSNDVGRGRVILTTIPGMMGLDEKAHPAQVYLMNGLTADLLPVQVLVNGKRPQGEVMYQLNRTKNGWLVMLVNDHGVDKTQTGIARVNRKAYVDVTLRTNLPLKAVREYTQPRDLPWDREGEVTVRVQPGDVQVVGFITQ